MEDKEILLKPKKTSKNIFSVFENKKLRYLFVFGVTGLLLVIVGFLGFSIFDDVKNIINMATGNVETKDEHIIESMNYILRIDPTDIQAEYFSELKTAIEEENADDETIAGLVVKNYVTDFYTWANKRGQYDVGGMYYVYTPQKKTIYIQARDGFYKNINHYMNEYGVKNLMEVEQVTIDSISKSPIDYVINETIEKIETTKDEETGETVTDSVFEDVTKEYDAYLVTCSWNYKTKEDSTFNTSKLTNKMNYLVIKNGNRFEIVEASSKKIEVKQPEEVEDEETQNEQSA